MKLTSPGYPIVTTKLVKKWYINTPECDKVVSPRWRGYRKAAEQCRGRDYGYRSFLFRPPRGDVDLLLHLHLPGPSCRKCETAFIHLDCSVFDAAAVIGRRRSVDEVVR